MACLIKVPDGNRKGVVSFTTVERDRLILRSRDLLSGIDELKRRFAVGLHHNWHDFTFRYNPLFDFHMAGEEDLVSIDGQTVPLVPLDACNFSPPFMTPGLEKFWDILFVARAVKFKGIPDFLRTIRDLYDRGHVLRVLFICPVPPAQEGSETTVRESYQMMFSSSEQERFTLLTMEHNYPFPLDLETLAHFYRSSRVFVHTAPDERRCRVAAYAWASGMPVVGRRCVGTVLPADLRVPPYFFEVQENDTFANPILAALQASKEGFDFSSPRGAVATEFSVAALNQHLMRIFSERGWYSPVGRVASDRLDLRLGRHHGLATGTNRIEQDLGKFISQLSVLSDTEIAKFAQENDPESAIAEQYVAPPRKEPVDWREIRSAWPPARVLRALKRILTDTSKP